VSKLNLKTNFMGLELDGPVVLGASPFSRDIDKARRCVDAGASAVVMHSLFEEQLEREAQVAIDALEGPADQFAEASTYLPEPPQWKIGPDEYLEQIGKLKRAVNVPVIASLNGTTEGGWVRYAKLIEQADADAIELNTYNLVTDPDESAADVERKTVELVRAVKHATKLPLAVKLSPFYTALPNLVGRLAEAGANAVVLFNRFYQPDIDVEELQVVRLHLSTSTELSLRLHWLAILYGRVQVDLALTGGVHTALDLIKSLMCGAGVTQVVSTVLRNGPQQISSILNGLEAFLDDKGYDSLDQLRGSMSLLKVPNPAAYVRNNYMQLVGSWD
jgi:dihydroorotate dehydrogenase (fumarate)